MTAVHGPAEMAADQPTGTIACTCGWRSDTVNTTFEAITALTDHMIANNTPAPEIVR